MTGKYVIRYIALGYLAVILVAPVGLIFYRAFEHGLGTFWNAVSNPTATHALKLTLEIAIVAVPLNTIFGILCALAIVRHRIPGMGLVNAIVDLPMALSPVVVGLSLYLLYGNNGWFGGWLRDHGIKVLFAYPGMLLATTFVSLPFVVREVVPVLREIGTEQEEAAATLGASALTTFWRITLPAIRWAVAYGVVLTMARSLGEFGAVAIVSGGIAGQTQTLTQYVQASYDNFDQTGAYAASVVLAALAIVTLLLMTMFRPREEIHGNRGA
jgi:sulfate transport system permease protein